MAFLFVPLTPWRSGASTRTNQQCVGLINLARNFGGSIGISFASTLVTRREQFHQSRLVEIRSAAER